MPLTVNVGLSKKVGLPDYGSLGASCHVQVELDGSLIFSDLDAFQQKVKQAFVACSQAVSDELYRQQSAGSSSASAASASVHGNGQWGNSQRGDGQPTGQRRSQPRKATASQVRAIEAIAGKLQLDLGTWLQERFGLPLVSELSITQASETIDALKAFPSRNGAAH
ncbi:MAG TPA: hypothetical protein VMP01_15515 [Pirellulaceae bacterium]|nr:hypothetical protein [Pirellulaceae bacterium]